MGTGVSPAVSYLDLESGPTLLHSAGKADCLHCGGGCIFFDWAPVLGNAPTGGAGATEGYDASDGWPKILFGAKLYVWHYREHWGDGYPSTSLYSSDDCEILWFTSNATFQWWPIDGDGESVGW
jgi:hypothetical protein